MARELQAQEQVRWTGGSWGELDKGWGDSSLRSREQLETALGKVLQKEAHGGGLWERLMGEVWGGSWGQQGQLTAVVWPGWEVSGPELGTVVWGV